MTAATTLGARAGVASELVPIREDMLDEVSAFLHEHINRQIPTDEWCRTLQYPWRRDGWTYGYVLRHHSRIVGVLCAFYSVQRIGGRDERFCNLHSWCVHPEHRSESLRLLQTLLRQRDHTITTLTVSKETVGMLRRFGFQPLDAQLALLPNPLLAARALRVGVATAREAVLAGVDDVHRRILEELGVMTEARASLARSGDAWCLAISRREKRRGVPTTRIVYVSHPVRFTAWLGAFARSFMLADATPVTTCPPRFLTIRPAVAVIADEPRPQLFKSERLPAADVTCLYSELTR